MTTPHWRRRAALALAGVALCVGGAAVFAPAQAAVDDTPVQWRVTEHPGANLPTDAESVGSRQIYPGVTLDQLGYTGAEADWAVYQEPFGTATSVIGEDFADDYAFAYFGPDRTFTVGFAGDAPAGAIALLDGTGLPYSTIEGVGFTDADYQSAVTRVSGASMDRLLDADLLSAAGPSAGLSVSADPTAAPGAIVVEITGDDADIRRAAMAAVASVSPDAGSTDAVSTDAPFTVTVVEGGGNMVLG